MKWSTLTKKSAVHIDSFTFLDQRPTAIFMRPKVEGKILAGWLTTWVAELVAQVLLLQSVMIIISCILPCLPLK